MRVKLSGRSVGTALGLAAALLAGFTGGAIQRRAAAQTFAMPVCNKVIAIDAGHGGWDPGKVSRGGIEEKGLNLAIADNLQQLLEQSGAFVAVTRADDSALADRKRADLDNRRAVADDSGADLFISIHQNSYESAKVTGPMVFYYGDSDEGKLLADAIQARMNEQLTGGRRLAHANSNYYVLKRTAAPSVLVECGFLSNEGEAEKLATQAYQEKVAWAIYLGIVDYFVNKTAE